MKKNLPLIILLALLSVAASTVTQIVLFTFYPNIFPTDSDVIPVQRGSSLFYSTMSQTRSYLFSSPSFTGNGYIPGQWHVGLGGILVDGGGIAFSGVAYGDGSGLTNINVTATNVYYNVITNSYLVVTNVEQINNSYITNLTVAVGGGETNLNLIPFTLMSVGQYQNEQSLPNGTGVLTNDGAGAIGWALSVQYSQLTAQFAYLTNVYTFLTNAEILGTDGNGQITNKSYKYSTNIVGAGAWTFGKAFWTNITADFTSPALTMQDNAAMETMAIFITNSAAATHTITIPGVAGAPGHVVPAVFYCTNATVTEIDVSHFGVLWTNACVGKN